MNFEENYFAFGVAVAVGAASFFVFVLSIFLTAGDAPGLAGDAVGDATGDATVTGLAVATGAGVVGGLFGVGC